MGLQLLVGEVVHELDGFVVEDVLGLDEDAQLRRGVHLRLEGLDVLDDLRVLVDPLHRVGLELELVLDDDAADEDDQAGHGQDGRQPVGHRPEPDDQPAERALPEVLALGRGLVLADAQDGERHDDAAEADGGDADGEQQAEVADHRHLGEAQGGEGEHRVEGDDQQGRAQVAGRLLDRVGLAVDDHLLLDARVHLDRVVDADAEHHRQAGDGDDGERDAEVAGQAERPDDADEDDAERQEAPPHVEEHQQDHHHDGDGDGAEREHAARQVVVDVLQQDRGTGGRGRGALELERLGGLLDEVAASPSVSMSWLPGRRTTIWACRSSGKNGRSDLRMLPSLSWSRKSTHSWLPITLSSGGIASTRASVVRRRRAAGLGSLGVAPGGGEQDAAGDARGDAPSGSTSPSSTSRRRRAWQLACDEVVGELQRRDGADDGFEHAASRSSASTLSQIARFSGVNSSTTVWPSSMVIEAEHGLAAEEVLVRDAVLVDLVVLVQVAVLAGGELQLGDAEPEHEGDDEADHRNQPGMLAQLQREGRPEALHVQQSVRRTNGALGVAVASAASPPRLDRRPPPSTSTSTSCARTRSRRRGGSARCATTPASRCGGGSSPWRRSTGSRARSTRGSAWSYGWSMMRIGALLRREDPALLDAWYAKAGTALHVEGRKPHDPDVARELLAEIGVDPGVVEVAIADPTTGDEVRTEHDTVVAAGGWGVPVLRFDDGQCFFGPVLVDAPKGEDAVRLWELVCGWRGFPHVYELQRPKTRGDIELIADRFGPYLRARDWHTVTNPTP